MATYLTARKLVSKVRQRIGDEAQGSSGLTKWSDAEILDAADDIYQEVGETVRMAHNDHELDRVELSLTDDFTNVEPYWYEYSLPEYVRNIRWVEGVDQAGNGIAIQPVVFSELESRQLFQAGRSMAAWTMTRWGRPGNFSIYGNLFGQVTTVRIWFIRRYPPLHFGTADGASTSGTLVFQSSPTGEVVLRDDLYTGMDAVNEDTGSLARITNYVGATRSATLSVSEDWSGDSYSLVLPLEPEIGEYFIQKIAMHFFMRSGNDQMMAVTATLLGSLESRAKATLARRVQGQNSRWINTR